MIVAFEYNEQSPIFKAGQPLTDVSFLVGVDGTVKSHHAKPAGIWNAEKSKMLWKVGVTSPTGLKQGKILAKFDVEGQTTPAALAVKFSGKGASLLGIDLVGSAADGGAQAFTSHFEIATNKYSAEPEASDQPPQQQQQQ